MKTHLLQKALPILLFVSLLSACSKDSNPSGSNNPGSGGGSEGSFTINGAGINNRTYNVGRFADAFFDTISNKTSVSMIGVAQGDSAIVFIDFAGSQAGSFPCDIQVGVGARSFSSILTTGSVRPTVNITNYGPVGGRVQGSFTGKIPQLSGAGNDSISITGNFNVLRR